MTPFDPPAQKQRARLEQAALLKAHKERRKHISGMIRDLDRSIWRDALRNFDSDFDRIFEVNPKNPVTQTGKTRY